VHEHRTHCLEGAKKKFMGKKVGRLQGDSEWTKKGEIGIPSVFQMFKGKLERSLFGK